MKTYEAWNYETIDSPRQIEALSPSDAATSFVELTDVFFFVAGGSDATVFVRDPGTGDVTRFIVKCVSQPVYAAEDTGEGDIRDEERARVLRQMARHRRMTESRRSRP